MIIIASKPGRLGNNLMLFAHFIAFSIMHNIKLFNPSFDNYAHYFESLDKNFFGVYPSKNSFLYNYKLRMIFYKFINFLARTLRRLKISNRFFRVVALDWDESVDLESKDFLEIALNTHFLFVTGWKFRSNIGVLKNIDLIRLYFKPQKKYLININSNLTHTNNNSLIRVGVHIRYGDYRYMWGGSHFFELDVYKNLMRQIVDLFHLKKVIFFISCNENLDQKIFSEFEFEFASGHELEDLYALSMCNYIFGPHSSYSLWASYYGNTPLYVLWDSNKKISIPDFKISDISD